MIRAPGFWRRDSPSPLARALAPLGAVYGAAAGARLARPAPRAALPVIVVGGLTLGGDGKTPTALALAALLRELGEVPAFSTRGYGGGAGRAPFRVDLDRHTAAEAGDELMLLARSAPTFAGADRLAAARLAQAAGASVLILDDGLHSRRIDADFAVAVVDAGHGAGNGLCPPAGPLRAPLLRQLAIVDAVVVIGAGAAGDAIAALARSSGKPVFRARARPDAEAARRLAGAPTLAFAGIARPGKILRDAGGDGGAAGRAARLSRSPPLFAAGFGRAGAAGAGLRRAAGDHGERCGALSWRRLGSADRHLFRAGGGDARGARPRAHCGSLTPIRVSLACGLL